jgi:hypothetical protein
MAKSVLLSVSKIIDPFLNIALTIGMEYLPYIYGENLQFKKDDYDFVDDFNSNTSFFSEDFCDAFRNEIYHLLMTNSTIMRQELVNRFPRKVYGYRLCYELELECSELQRCLKHLPEPFTQQIRIQLEKEIMQISRYSGKLVFLFFRYIDIFAYQSKLPNICFGKHMFDDISRFNTVVSHFTFLFHKQRKVRDILPMCRAGKKRDLKKDSFDFFMVHKSFKEISVFIKEHILKKELREYCEMQAFMKNVQEFFYFIIFNFSKVDLLDQVAKVEYYSFLFSK